MTQNAAPSAGGALPSLSENLVNLRKYFFPSVSSVPLWQNGFPAFPFFIPRPWLAFAEFLLDENELGRELFHLALELVHGAGGGVEFAPEIGQVALARVPSTAFHTGDLGEKIPVDRLIGDDVRPEIVPGNEIVHKFHRHRIRRQLHLLLFNEGKDRDNRTHAAKHQCADNASGLED